MTRTIASLGILILLAGCDAVDYYPTHETPEQRADLTKSGPDAYGGNNAAFPIGTPGTNPQPGAQPTTTAPSAQANSPALDTRGSGAFPEAGSYSGTSVGGGIGSPTRSVPVDGTTVLGAGR